MRPLRMPVLAALATILAWASGGLVYAANAAAVTKVPCGTSLTSLRPTAGSTLELSRNCTFKTALTITANSVTVTSYGSGSLPVIMRNTDGAAVSLYGSRDTIKNLTLIGVAPRSWFCGGMTTPAGHVDGVDVYPGATGDIITNITATAFYAGVYIMAGASGNTVQNSTLKNNIELDTNSSSGSAGAFGVLLWGNNNTVHNNNIDGNQACSLAYGRDGSAIEVFGGSGNAIDSNTTWNNNTFVELGSYSQGIASGNSFTANSVSDGPGGLGSTFLVTRGSADQDGPVYNTTVASNTVNLTKPGDQGAVSYAWQPGDGTLLTLTGNYLNLGTNQVLYEDGGYVDGGGNTFIGTCNPSSNCP